MSSNECSTYKITGHYKGTVTIERPTIDTTHIKEAHETWLKADSLGGLFWRYISKTGSAQF